MFDKPGRWFCLLFLVFHLLSGGGWAAVKKAAPDEPLVEVVIKGVEGQLLQNVQARLRINHTNKEQPLSATQIRHLHGLAEENIESALAPYGYFSPTIAADLTRQKGRWVATYTIDPGQQVIINQLQVDVLGEGRELEALRYPARDFLLRPGDPLNQTQYKKDKARLLHKARNLGFLDATYSVHEIRVNRHLHKADIELILDTGTRYTFGQIFTEQEVITPKLFFRYFPFSQGDVYDPKLLSEVQSSLNKTQYFKRVTLETSPGDEILHQVPVEAYVIPLESRNRYSVGVGYATDILTYFTFDWYNKLLNHQGHHTYSSLLIGENESHLILNYNIPGVDPRYQTLTATGAWNREIWEGTDSEKYTAGVTYEYAMPEQYLAFALEFLDEEYEIGDDADANRLLIPSARASLTFADDVVNTTNGLRAEVNLSGASEDVFSDASFLKLRGEGKLILTPIESWRLIGRGSIGGILVDDIDDIPPSLRFYTGGAKSVRGYSYRSLGPEDEDGDVVGGQLLLTGSIACEKQFSGNLTSAVFYDAGNALDDFSTDLAHSVGISLGLKLPFGQATLELAYPLSEMGSKQYVFISVGADL